MAIAAGAATVAAAGYGVYSSSKTASAAKKASEGGNYVPVDLDALQQRAREAAVTNASASIRLEKDVRPDQAASRVTADKLTADRLAQGGNLSPDVQRQVTQSAQTQSAISGAPASPITAAKLGLTAMSQQDKAIELGRDVSKEAYPESGLSGKDMANVAIGDSNALNAAKQTGAAQLADANKAKAESTANMVGVASKAIGSYFGTPTG